MYDDGDNWFLETRKRQAAMRNEKSRKRAVQRAAIRNELNARAAHMVVTLPKAPWEEDDD